MQVSILGPVEVRIEDGRPVAVAGRRVRTLLARLAADPGRAVAVDALVDELWAAEPPVDPANALQSLVSRLRRALSEPGAVVQDAGGYRLDVAPQDIDAVRLQQLVEEAARATSAQEADPVADRLRGALARSRGRALPELDPALGRAMGPGRPGRAGTAPGHGRGAWSRP